MGEVIVWTSADLNHQMAASTVIGDVSICLTNDTVGAL